jgi:hypothetical protein
LSLQRRQVPEKKVTDLSTLIEVGRFV